MSVRRASCSCGQLVVLAEGEPLRVAICHCLACQQRTGNVFGVQARFPADKVRVEGPSKIYRRVADSGRWMEFHFCPDCGATVYYRLEVAPDAIGVPVGAFADTSFPTPAISIHEAHQHPWVLLPPGIGHPEG